MSPSRNLILAIGDLIALLVFVIIGQADQKFR